MVSFRFLGQWKQPHSWWISKVKQMDLTPILWYTKFGAALAVPLSPAFFHGLLGFPMVVWWGEKTEVDLERGESDLGEAFTPQILPGYYTDTSAPTEVWFFGRTPGCFKYWWWTKPCQINAKVIFPIWSWPAFITLQTVWYANKRFSILENLPGEGMM